MVTRALLLKCVAAISVAALAAASILMLKTADGAVGPERPLAPGQEAADPDGSKGSSGHLWATTIPNTTLSSGRVDFSSSDVDEFFLDITNPQSSAVKVSAVRYPAFRSDKGAVCSVTVPARSTRRCLFDMRSVPQEPAAVLVGSKAVVGITAYAMFGFRRNPIPPETRVTTEKLMVPVQVQQMK